MPSRIIIESWLKTLTPYNYTPAEFSDVLMRLGLEVESIDDRNAMLEGFVVGEVLTKVAHKNADKLSVCTVTTGGEPVTVVCGAPNVAAGQKIAFAPVGIEIPTAGFRIEKRKIRGVVSEGMICSEQELELGESHEGILVLPADAIPGTPLRELFGDVIYGVDITPNRGDCLSHLGIAREIAAVTGGTVTLPTPTITEGDEATADAITVDIQAPELCPRYVARVVKGVTIGPSPAWLQDIIRKLGLRPRNNVVDIASYVLFECGHPLHAFDLDLVAGNTIVVRTAKKGEKFTTLDSKERELPEDALMICDAEKPVAIAGVMGGENSEIHDGTVNVLIESAYFNPSSIRKTAKQLGLATDASYRFERGADIANTIYAVNRAAALIAELAGGRVCKGIVDAYPTRIEQPVIEYRFARANEIIGIEIPDEKQVAILHSLGFGVEPASNGKARVTVPTHRTDIVAEIDLVEEIARMNGYDAIPTDSRAAVAFDVSVHPQLKLMNDTRRFFVDNGFTEVVSPHLVDPETAEAFGSPVGLRNALGRDTSMLRTSLAPSMGKIVGSNERYSRPNLRLFEVGKAFRAGRPDQGVIPGVVEMEELAVVISGQAGPLAWDMKDRQADIYDLRGMLERYFLAMGIRDITWKAVDTPMWGLGAPALAIHAGQDEVGRVGPLDAGIIKQHDITGKPVAALIDIERIVGHAYAHVTYKAPSRFPAVQRDLSFLVDLSVTNSDITSVIRTAGEGLLSDVRIFDLYQGKGVEPGKKSVAYALTFSSHERTLEDETVDTAVTAIVAALAKQVGAELRS